MSHSARFSRCILFVFFSIVYSSTEAQDIFKTFDDTAMVIREANATTAPMFLPKNGIK